LFLIFLIDFLFSTFILIFWKIPWWHSYLELLHNTWKLRYIWSLIIFITILFEVWELFSFWIYSFLILEFFISAAAFDKIWLVIILHSGYNFLILYISRRVDGWNKLLMSFGILWRKSIIVNWWIRMWWLLIISCSFVYIEFLNSFSQAFVVHLKLHFFVLVLLLELFLFVIYHTFFLINVLKISFWFLLLIIKIAFLTLLVFKLALTILILFI
jgi:hypothetical protein